MPDPREEPRPPAGGTGGPAHPEAGGTARPVHPDAGGTARPAHPEAGGVAGTAHPDAVGAPPSPRQLRKWRRYLADERAEASVYRDLAGRRGGEEREILLALAEAEGRHEQHWQELLGDRIGRVPRGDLRTRMLGFLARRFGSVFVLALAQRAEARSPYEADDDATARMAADERIHEEVVRALAMRGRQRLSGSFRAAVFGVNDGLVSNLSLVLGVGATGVATHFVLLTGVAGLLAGALSMGAGEYVSVRSQRELLEASRPGPHTARVLPHLDINANELTLVYRARGMSEADAARHSREVLDALQARTGALPVQGAADAGSVGRGSGVAGAGRAGDGRAGDGRAGGGRAGAGRAGAGRAGAGRAGDGRAGAAGAAPAVTSAAAGAARAAGAAGAADAARASASTASGSAPDEHEAIGTGMSAALSSFCFFAAGAVIPVLPYLFGMGGLAAVFLAAGLVGIALLGTGAIVGLLSGAPPLRRALRQLGIGYGAAAITYALGLLFGTNGA